MVVDGSVRSPEEKVAGDVRFAVGIAGVCGEGDRREDDLAATERGAGLNGGENELAVVLPGLKERARVINEGDFKVEAVLDVNSLVIALDEAVRGEGGTGKRAEEKSGESAHGRGLRQCAPEEDTDREEDQAEDDKLDARVVEFPGGEWAVFPGSAGRCCGSGATEVDGSGGCFGAELGEFAGLGFARFELGGEDAELFLEFLLFAAEFLGFALEAAFLGREFGIRASGREACHSLLCARGQGEDPNDEADSGKDLDREGECEPALQPVTKSAVLIGRIVTLDSGIAGLVGGGGLGGNLRLGLGKLGAGILHAAEGLAEFAGELRIAPRAGVDGFQVAEVLGERIIDRVELLEAFLGFLDLALDDHERAGELVEHVGASGLEFVLTPLEFLEALFFAFDFLLFLLEALEFGANLLHFVSEFPGGILIEVEVGVGIFAVVCWHEKTC